VSEKIAVSVNEASEMLGLGRDVTYRLVLGGEIDSFKVGARRLVPVQAIRDFVETNSHKEIAGQPA